MPLMLLPRTRKNPFSSHHSTSDQYLVEEVIGMVVMPWKVNQLQMGSVMPAFSQYMDVVNIIRLYPSYTDVRGTIGQGSSIIA